MSIIHDALKKVQESLSPKPVEPPVEQLVEQQPAKAQENPAAIFAPEPPPVETLPQAPMQPEAQKPPVANKIKSILALACALVIMATSALYIYQQLRSNLPKVQNFAKKSLFKLIHKTSPADLKANPPVNLTPMAQLTITPPSMKSSNPAKPSLPVTLDIHGIMSNASGNLVLINDQVYQEGDEVDGAKITKINLDSITIINNGVEQTIPVKD